MVVVGLRFRVVVVVVVVVVGARQLTRDVIVTRLCARASTPPPSFER